MTASPSSPGSRRLTALRLAAQRIDRDGWASPVDAVRWMLAMQGQDLPGVEWSIGLRCAGVTLAAVDHALATGAIVRSWPMRSTLHVVAAEDLGWLLTLTGSRMIASAARRRRNLGLTETDTNRVRTIVTEALAGGRILTREQVLATLDAAGVSTSGQRGYHLLAHLSQAGTLVLGPPHGSQQTFALLDEWVPHPRRLERDEALGELALRYFRSHGPATDHDLARWCGLTLGEIRRGVEVCGSGLETADVDRTTYRLAREVADAHPTGDADPTASARPSPALLGPGRAPAPPDRVHLLPGFDEYLLGYGDRSAALAPEHAASVVPGGNGMFKPTIVADGVVVGTWARKITAREIVVVPAPFEPLAPAIRDGLERAAEAYGAFVGRPVRVA